MEQGTGGRQTVIAAYCLSLLSMPVDDERARLLARIEDLEREKRGFESALLRTAWDADRAARERDALAAKLDALPARPDATAGFAVDRLRRKVSRTLRRNGKPTAASGTAPVNRSTAAKPAGFVEEAMRAFDGLGAAGSRPVFVGYHPGFEGNPYQRMLYSQCDSNGVAALVVPRIADMATLAERVGGRADLWLHLHWTWTVFGRAASRAACERRLDAFIANLDRLRELGVKIAYTAHDVLPFEARYLDLEARCLQAIIDRSEIVFTFCAQTPELVSERYEIPTNKVRVLPHSSYSGMFPVSTIREQARAKFGLSEEHTALVLVGAIRHYKGCDLLVDAFEEAAQTDPNLRLLIAGKPGAYPEAPELEKRCKDNKAITAQFSEVADDEIASWYLASDVAVVPYREGLMSGAVFTAFTFGRPVIASNIGCLPSIVTTDLGLVFDRKEPGGLRDALLAAPKLRDPSFVENALQRSQEYGPAQMSNDFCAALKEAE